MAYVITEKDIKGPFIEKVPEDYREKATLKQLSLHQCHRATCGKIPHERAALKAT